MVLGGSAISGCASEGEGDLPGPVDYQYTVRTEFTDVHIDPDGTMTRTHIVGPTETLVLDPSTVADLRRAILDAQFPTLAPRYGCGGCADDAVHTITVELGGRSYTVEAEEHDANVPVHLRPAIETLYAISQTPVD